ncbi:ABC transporter ATP-binding protein [Halosegnis marinus]|uniref:ABC transporter ATP-binding protein n=1 Tax=Halosegnis marinus TaxID=3034023 RepID=A0ABD5ZQM1_9EURY|nr:ABC transporter ATP-binding protein [Halosegnis sp. DT85]
MSDPLLSVRGLRGGYGLTEVLQGVDLAVEAGRVSALVGRNGVGKTTTMRAITGNIEPTAGTVTFDGEDITAVGPEGTARLGIGFVPEERRVFPGLTVRENIRMGALGAEGTGPGVEDVLDTFENLREREHSHASVLSGGEQQMLAIARALVGDPDLLLLDEPTEGLAPYVVRRIESVIEDLDMAVLLVEQNVQVALDVADHAYVMDRGRVVHEGPAADVRDDEETLGRYLGVGDGGER